MIWSKRQLFYISLFNICHYNLITVLGGLNKNAETGVLISVIMTALLFIPIASILAYLFFQNDGTPFSQSRQLITRKAITKILNIKFLCLQYYGLFRR